MGFFLNLINDRTGFLPFSIWYLHVFGIFTVLSTCTSIHNTLYTTVLYVSCLITVHLASLKMGCKSERGAWIHDLWPTLPLRVYFSVSIQELQHGALSFMISTMVPGSVKYLPVIWMLEGSNVHAVTLLTFLMPQKSHSVVVEIIEGKWGGQFGQFGSWHWGAEWGKRLRVLR